MPELDTERLGQRPVLDAVVGYILPGVSSINLKPLYRTTVHHTMLNVAFSSWKLLVVLEKHS